ncbi:hypothetical protein AEMCBJ_01665 [Cupriavidus necator]|uniref:hypothetical protein n=1 Tax=Cupriavidus necator TaxID=106590 RepID=UPI003F7319BC
MALNEITEAIDIAQKRAALKAELDSLTKQEEEVKARAHADAVAQVQEWLNCFQIARDELTFTAPLTLVPRFLNPETGDMWHGYGKRPEWINDDNIDEYRIKPLKNGKKTGKKSVTKTDKQAKSKTTQPVAEHAEASDVQATATDISATIESEVASSAPITTAPEDIATKSKASAVAENTTPEDSATGSKFAQQPISAQGRQSAVNYAASSPMAAGIQSYVNAARSI